MADDQVKYSELIVDDNNTFEALTKALDDVKGKLAGLRGEATNLSKELKEMNTATRQQQQAMSDKATAAENLRRKVRELTDEEAKLEALRKRYKKLNDDEIANVEKLRTSMESVFNQMRRGNPVYAQQINEIDAQNKSYNELYQTYNALKDVINKMTVAERENTAAGKAMVDKSRELREMLNNLQQQTGVYTLNVGNYMSAMNGLQLQTQQLLREIPSAQNLSQFFLAISNNIPMFADAMARYNKGLPEIKAKLAAVQYEIVKQEAALAGMNAQSAEAIAKQAELNALKKQELALQNASVSGWRAVLKSVGSWQTLLIAGLLLLRKIPDILKSISEWFNRATVSAKQLHAVNEGAANSIGEMTAKYKALQQEWKSLKAEDMPKWLEQHKDDWKELGYSIDDAKKAEDFYVNNTAAVQKAIDDRARSISAMKLAAQKYEEAFKKQVEAEEGLNRGRMSKRSSRAQAIAMVGMTEGTGGVASAEQQAWRERAAKEAAKAYYDEQMKEVEALKKEAENYLKFVQPDAVVGGSNKEKEPKDPKKVKDQVADLLALERALEDQIIANIENVYKREEQEEIKRHERFVEDKEKELVLLKNDPERRAVINKQIEEESVTHERKMFEIDEKRRQELIKASEEEEQRRKKEEDEAFKAAEKEFKMRQEIAKREFELTKHSATEEKKFVMQQQMELLQWRIDNAEALGLSPEMLEVMEKELKQMQELFDKGIYSTGKQNIKGNYNSIVDLLFPGWDNDKQNAFNSVFDQAKAALNSWMDARKAAADQAKELADDEVSAAENALNREIELRNQGYANDVALREKELADAKEAQKKAAEEQKKVAQEQVLLDAALQTSSMITASANIIKQFPNPLAWAPMLALMWGTFAYAKTKAYQASTKSIKFKEGGVMLLEGGSHESGHDVNLGIGPDGSNLRAEGGEYFAVINKRSSRKYGSQIPAVVNALNSGMFEDRYIKTSDAVGLLPQVIRADNGTAVDLSSLEGGVDALVKQGESRWSTEGEWRVMRYKNLTRRVRIS